MARTLPQIRQGIGRLLGLRSFYSTADSSGNTTTNLRDAALRAFPSSYFNGMWLRVTSGTDINKNFFITMFTNTNGDLTVTPAASAATVFNSATYEIYPIHPSFLIDAINQAVRGLYPFVGRTVVDESFVTNSPLWNPGFEDWGGGTTAPVGYAATTSSLAQETTNKLTGYYSIKLSGAVGSFGLTVAHTVALSQLMGNSITAYAWVKSDTASSARLQLGDSDGTTNGSYHSGGNNWELISVNRTMRGTSPPKQDAYTLKLLHDSAAAVDYMDRWWLEGGPPVYRYRAPGTMPRGPSAVYVSTILNREHMQHNVWVPVSFTSRYQEDPNANTGYTEIQIDRASVAYGYFPAFVSFGRAMMLVGRDSPTNLAVDADYLEVDEITGELVEVEAALLLLTMYAGSYARQLAVPGNERQTGADYVRATLAERRKWLMTHARERGEPAQLSKDV